MNTYSIIGKIIETKGFKGWFLCKWYNPIDLEQREYVFLADDKNCIIPFFIEDFKKIDAYTAQLKLIDINTLEGIQPFLSKNIYIELLTAVQTSETVDCPTAIIGYEIVVDKVVVVGTIEDIVNNNGQLLIIANSTEGKEILIPYTSMYVIKIVSEQKRIYMDLPHGLVYING